MSTPGPLDPGTLLPWYLNGSLAPHEREEVENWLVSSSEGQAELLLWRAVQLDTRARPQADAGSELGWRRLQTRLPKPERRRPAAGPWRWAAAASVLAILGLQSVLLLRQPVEQVHQPLTLPAQADTWQVQVRFVDEATLAELQALLSRHDANIVDGPSALGIYTLSIARSGQSAEQLSGKLRAEPLVLQVSVMP